MALNFPDSPSVNDIFTSGSSRWQWDGSSWVRQGSAGAQGAGGATGAQGSAGAQGLAGAQGAAGAAGAQGATGAAGAQGVAGPTAGSNGQVVYNSGGSATGSSNLTFDGNHLTVGGNLNVGGVLTYEDVTNIDAIGIITARTDIHVGAGVSAVGILTASTADFTGTGAVEITSGTTAQRPSSPAAGMMRYNTDNAQFDGYSSAWGGFGGASGASGNAVFYENDTNVSASYSITSGKNAMSAGPITINNGVTVTVPSGSVWTVV